MANDATRQLHIIHLTDLHFGNDHRFMAPAPVSGGPVHRPGYPSLLDKLTEDFKDPSEITNLIICLTGDFVTDAGNEVEFERAEQFVRGLAEADIHGSVRGMDNIFVVPGNHDVGYDRPTLGQRWAPYSQFLSRIRKQYVDRDNPLGMVEVHRRDDLGAIILCLNSEIYIQNDKDNRYRGEIDTAQLTKVDELLADIPDEYIKIALIHHHPILIPDLAEPGRNYDAVLNSGALLRILRDKGFHAVLHGHKHNPFVFSEDSQSAWTGGTRQPIVVVAGGSVGSRGTPESYLYRGNCYNRITIKWHPAAHQSRVNIETRGLKIFNEAGEEIDIPRKWTWEKLREYDMPFFAVECRPKACKGVETAVDTTLRDEMNRVRVQEYGRLRGNMLVVDVLPSLVSGQAYEARLWIVGHSITVERELPIQVIWTPGKGSPVKLVTARESKWFAVSYEYWAPMLVQAQLRFADGITEDAHIYARLPEDCS
jgi:3',5'-cyclic AMP phosphodiesterase CpdA